MSILPASAIAGLGEWGQRWMEALYTSDPESYREMEAKGTLRQEAEAAANRGEALYQEVYASLERSRPAPKEYEPRVQHLMNLASMAREQVAADLLPMSQADQDAMTNGYSDPQPNVPENTEPDQTPR